ncbi:MAG: type II toxin-antitoxin system HipA family toxin, partial [Dermatophilaceae bacterium]
MTSDPPFVWAWTPGATEPVVAGRLQPLPERRWGFVYGRSYLRLPQAIALGPDLPLEPGLRAPASTSMTMPGTIRDACPDAWGQRVIRYLLTGDGEAQDPDWPTTMLASESNRVGALDFQASAVTYHHRGRSSSLETLIGAADDVLSGAPMDPAIEAALLHGTSIGGARPKVTLSDGDGGGAAGDGDVIVKLSTSTDPYPVVRYEATAMELARRTGLPTADSRVEEHGARDLLVVRRFDRGVGTRRQVVSGLTLLGLDELEGRYATYPDLLDALRAAHTFAFPLGRRLFHQIAVRIAVGDTDDHARNIAAFWDGRQLELTPAYDIAPGLRSGETASQAMAYGLAGQRESSFATLASCGPIYGLSTSAAREIIDRVIDVIRTQFDDAADAGHLTVADRAAMRGRQVLNPGVMHGY